MTITGQKITFTPIKINFWTVVVVLIATLMATPVIVVSGSIFSNTGNTWGHLASTVLGRYVTNSLILMVGVAIGVLILGVSNAWLVTMCRFRGVSLLRWMLLLPLAAPAYILAYVYTELLEYYGPIQTTLRQIFVWKSASDYWFPNIRSVGGAIIMLTLALYPYVYLLARVAFLEQSRATLEASRCLGCSPWSSFWQVAIPLARPSIMAGLALALMETLNDYGTVQFFGVDTFTTGIYRTWFGLGEREAASQLAAVLTLFVLALILIELWARKQAKYYQPANGYQQIYTYHLQGIRGILALIVCLLPIVLGFFIPTGLLLHMGIANGEQTFSNNFWQLSKNSFLLASLSAIIGVILAVILAYGQRLCPNWLMALGVRISALGYAIPGSVIAVGIMFPLGQVDNWLNSWLKSNFGVTPGLLLSGTIIALIFAYLVRFLAVAFNPVESSLGKIKPHLDEASRSLGNNATRTLWRVHLPLMSGSLLTAAMLMFVDVMKELPASIVIRPFNFDTLAIAVYQYASDERLAEAAAPALAILLVGLIPVIFLTRQISQSRP